MVRNPIHTDLSNIVHVHDMLYCHLIVTILTVISHVMWRTIYTVVVVFDLPQLCF